ncbi:MAG TPA: hypothetical protein VK576_11230, partial [Thermoleophilia bacterium]|nr:hypothetical protein [Thermoleophilia bacterium]
DLARPAPAPPAAALAAARPLVEPGSGDAREAARGLARDLLATHEPPSLGADVDAELRRLIGHEDDAR